MPEVNIPSNTPVEDQAHVDAMVAKADQGVGPNGAPQGAPATDAKPEWLGDFESPEAMAKAYNELRAKMSQDGAPKQEQPAPKQEAQTAPGEATREQASEAAEKAGVDIAALETEFTENGGLTDDTYAKLEQAGFDRSTVDAYIAGQQALNEQMQSRIEEHVGGGERLQSALEWAAQNLGPAEAQAFNNVVDTADEAGLKLALDGLMAKFDAAGGSEPSLIGGSVNTNSGSVFRSTAELTAAMSDPRYSRDPAYRAEVEQRLARSSIF